jgi:hypothetical protein
MPPIGIGVPHGADRLGDSAVETLARLGVGWHVVALDMRREGLLRHLAAARNLAARANAAIQLEIITPGDASSQTELDGAAEICAAAGLEPRAVLALPAPYLKSYQPSDRWPSIEPQAWVEAAHRAFPKAKIGGGMVTNFTELNRRRPNGQESGLHLPYDDRDRPCRRRPVGDAGARNAAAHRRQRPCRLAAFALSTGALVHRDAIEPLWRGSDGKSGWTRVPLADRDPRLLGLFGAAWTTGFAAAIAGEGLDLVALHASHGLLGLVSVHGLTPAYHVVAALSAAKDYPQVWFDVAKPLAALAWQTKDGIEGLVANLTAEAHPCPPFVTRARVLDEATAKAAAADPEWSATRGLPRTCKAWPYAVAFCTVSSR